jgi:hypothetical protein
MIIGFNQIFWLKPNLPRILILQLKLKAIHRTLITSH